MSTSTLNDHGVRVTSWWASPAIAVVRFLRGYGPIVFLVFYLHIDQATLVRIVRLVQEEAPRQAVGLFLELVTMLALLWVLWRLLCAGLLLLLKPHRQGVNYWALLPEHRGQAAATSGRGEV